MSGLDHDFGLIPVATDLQDFQLMLGMKPPGVKLHDDVLTHMWDTLNWIPTVHLVGQVRPHLGLNRWGMSVINADGAPVAARLLGAWSSMLSCGPARIGLRTSAYLGTRGGASFRRFIVERDELVRCLDAIVAMLDEVMKGKQVLLQRGV